MQAWLNHALFFLQRRTTLGNVEYFFGVIILVKNKLKEIRMKEYMMIQKDFANLLDIDYRQYNNYEHGTVPTLETALKISKKLTRPLEDIFIYQE
jgi:DNA-binding XRE family transcriptional regulator